jgi:hypothetical protein
VEDLLGDVGLGGKVIIEKLIRSPIPTPRTGDAGWREGQPPTPVRITSGSHLLLDQKAESRCSPDRGGC